MRILGIDPGSAATGYGVIERREGRLVHLAHGTLRPARASSLVDCLDHLHRGIAQVLSEQRPDCVAIERVFVALSPASALVLGQARGALLAAVGGARLPIAEFTATEVKRALAGNGHAGKAQKKGLGDLYRCQSTQRRKIAASSSGIRLCSDPRPAACRFAAVVPEASRQVDLESSYRRKPPVSPGLEITAVS